MTPSITVVDRTRDGANEVIMLPVAPLEARGRGHWLGIEMALVGAPRALMLQVRPDVLTPVAPQLDDLALPAPPQENKRSVDTITRSKMAHRSST